MKLAKPISKTSISAAILLLSVFFAYFLSFTALFQTIELKLLDLKFKIRGPVRMAESPVVILAIDDQSDEATAHRWPWPRSYFAHVIENLEAAGAAAIGVDVIFDQPDRYNPEYDDQLARVLNKYDNIVLTGKLLIMQHDVSYSTLMPPYSKFSETNARWGLSAIEADIDGFYRRYLIGQFHNDTIVPSFGIEVIRAFEGIADTEPLISKSDYYHFKDYQIPKLDAYSMLINFRGPARTFPYYSFVNVLDDSSFDILDDYDLDAFDDPGDAELGIPPGLKFTDNLKGKIVLIGSTMHELHDNFPTPFLEYRNSEGDKVKAEMPGVEIHANAIATILANRYLHPLPEFFNFLIVLLLGILVYFIARKFKTVWSTVTVAIAALLYLGLVILLFVKANLLLEISAPLLVMLFSFIGHTVYEYVLALQEKQVLRGAFAHYVPDKVVQEIINNPDKLSLGGEEREVTVLFSDVEGFTSLSEQLKPKELVSLLNEYLTEMTTIVLKHNGVIDKFEGDAIMAEFGVPVSFSDHAGAACRSALEMQKELRRLRGQWTKHRKPALYARIGINTGEVIVGNMGSRDVFDYTVIGDHVNLGARLESANKYYGTYIMISEFTNEVVKNDFYTRPLDFIRVVGKKQAIEVYELIGERSTKFTDKFLQMLEFYHQGIMAYRSRQWDRAINLFDRCLHLVPGDNPASIYRMRCVDNKANPPGDDWDFVTSLTGK